MFRTAKPNAYSYHISIHFVVSMDVFSFFNGYCNIETKPQILTASMGKILSAGSVQGVLQLQCYIATFVRTCLD